MIDQSGASSFCDNLRLLWEIEQNIVVSEGENRSVIQEFAFRLGQKNWRKPANIYDIINKKRPATLPWTLKAAEVLGIPPYNLFPRWLLLLVINGLFDELRETKAPMSVMQALENHDFENKEFAPYSRLFHDVFYVKDTSMEPSLIKGKTVRIAIENLLDSNSVESGQLYYVEHRNGDFNIRMVYSEEGGKRFILQPLNNRFEVVLVEREKLRRISPIL